jgi:hypothetical protein
MKLTVQVVVHADEGTEAVAREVFTVQREESLAGDEQPALVALRLPTSGEQNVQLTGPAPASMASATAACSAAPARNYRDEVSSETWPGSGR